MADTISTSDVARATRELAAMKRSLAQWLHVRAIGDQVLAGQGKTKKPLPYAQRVIAGARDPALEQDLAQQLYGLLSTVMPDAALPDPAVPGAAVVLAQIAVTGKAPTAQPQSVGGFFASPASHPWLWPVLIVGALLIAVTTAIKTAADVAKDKEEKACIEAGACTDFGFWLKAGGAVVLAWFAWKQLGVGDVVKDFVQSKRRSKR